MNTTKKLSNAVKFHFSNESLAEQDIRSTELTRAHRAFVFLKNKLGSDALIALMQEELDSATIQTEKWVEDSKGEWKSGFVLIEMPNVKAEQFHNWFTGMVIRGDEKALRAAHPDHYCNRLLPDGRVEVVENFGEFEYPWHFFLNLIPIDATIPVPADKDYPIGFAAIIKSKNGKLIAHALHELRDYQDGMQVKLTAIIPKAAPDTLIRGHLNHFSIEFRNWYNAMSAE